MYVWGDIHTQLFFTFQIKKKYQVRKQIRVTKKYLDISYWRKFPDWGNKEKTGMYISHQEYFCNIISYQNDIDVLIYKAHNGYSCDFPVLKDNLLKFSITCNFYKYHL